MKRNRLPVLALLATLGTLSAPTSAAADEVKVLCSNGLREVMLALASRFQRESDHHLLIMFAPTSALKPRIDAGEAFDLAVLTPAAIDDAIKQGTIDAKSRAVIARSGLGVAIQSGARKMDISTVDAFRRALLNANSITYPTEGASAAPFTALVDRLGIAPQMIPRYLKVATAAEVGDAVAEGRAELGVLPISEILPLRGAELLGPFPPEAQSYVVMTGGVSKKAKNGRGAKQLMKFLTSGAVLPVIKEKGMER